MSRCLPFFYCKSGIFQPCFHGYTLDIPVFDLSPTKPAALRNNTFFGDWNHTCSKLIFCTVDGRNPANHLGCKKPVVNKWKKKLPINCCNISSINSITLQKINLYFPKKWLFGNVWKMIFLFEANSFWSFPPLVLQPAKNIQRNTSGSMNSWKKNTCAGFSIKES